MIIYETRMKKHQLDEGGSDRSLDAAKRTSAEKASVWVDLTKTCGEIFHWYK
jgi:hypothetical protein